MWEELIPKLFKKWKVEEGLNRAVVKFHWTKLAFRKLWKLWIEYKTYELPWIKEEKEWQEARLKEIEDLKW